MRPIVCVILSPGSGSIDLNTNTDPEMEVTEIILTISRLCQLSSHSRGFLSRLLDFFGGVGVYLLHFRPYFIILKYGFKNL